MTRDESIEATIEVWEDLAKTGKEKSPYLMMEYHNGCPLCQFTRTSYGKPSLTIGACVEKCPYARRFGYTCMEPVSPYRKWDGAHDKVDRKKYAKMFLKQLRLIPLDHQEEMTVEEALRDAIDWITDSFREDERPEALKDWKEALDRGL